MRKSRLPILIVIPHGGVRAPEELEGYSAMSDFDLFFQGDSCANDLFSFNGKAAAQVDTYISRFFVDTDRKFTALPPSYPDGVIKKMDYNKKNIFRDDIFPNDIAISNILKRYYFPFHDSIEKKLAQNSIKLIIVCHTMMPTGPQTSPDAGKARPLILVENSVADGDETRLTCPASFTETLAHHLKKNFSGEDATVAEKVSISERPATGIIIQKYGSGDIPLLRLSVSKALFINDTYFSFDYLRVDDLRIRDLKHRLWDAVEKTAEKLL